MSSKFTRRWFMGAASLATTAFALPRLSFAMTEASAPFKISLAEWSLHRTIRDEKKITNLDFAKVAKEEFGIDAIEYVNQFFADKAKDTKYLSDLKQRAADNGVTSLLIMVDGEGNLGDPSDEARLRRWIITRSGSMQQNSSVAIQFASMQEAVEATKISKSLLLMDCAS
jgi:hypothetical protein